MKADGPSPLIDLRQICRAGPVGLAALLLASCSTSGDPFAQLGLVAQPAYQQPAGQPAEAAVPEADSGNYYIIAEDDPALPDEVAERPSLSDGSEPATAAALAAVPSESQPAAQAPAVDDAVLAARMGADGAYLETVPGEQQTAAAAAPVASAPEKPKKRGFLASLFGSPEPARSPTPVIAPPAPQPTPADASADPEPSDATADPGDDNPAGEADAAESGTTAVAAAAQPEAPKTPQPTAYFENRPPQTASPAARAPEPRRRGFLSAFFSGGDETARAEPRRPQPVVRMAGAAPAAAASATNVYGSDILPGVRDADSLYDIKRKSGTDDVSDIDINEGDNVQLAMAPGLARLAPNGLMVQTERVDVACLKPSLVRVLKVVERHYGEKVVVTSGYRSPPHNARARGSRNSLHMYCAAADIQVDGVDKWELAQFLRAMPGRGGVGTYCHTKSVHVDVGPERDWNWRCRRRKKK